jgi:hypothetical protein
LVLLGVSSDGKEFFHDGLQYGGSLRMSVLLVTYVGFALAMFWYRSSIQEVDVVKLKIFIPSYILFQQYIQNI